MLFHDTIQRKVDACNDFRERKIIEMSPKISIIIPVYNSEKYLDRCLKSIVEQSYDAFEIILVDDGSKDNSPAICDKWNEIDARVKVIHKKNGGTSSARNVGLDAVRGEYVTFMDNDDYWDDPNCLSKVMACLDETKADVLMHECKVYWIDDDAITLYPNKCRRENVAFKPAKEALGHIISSGGINRCVWAKVMKTSLINDNKIRFPEGMRNEDTDFVGKLLLVARSYDWYEDSFYVYCKGHEGAQTTQKLNVSMVRDLEKICIDYVEKVEKTIEDKEFKKVLLSYIAYPYAVWMGQSTMVDDKKAIKEDKKRMKKYSSVLKNNLDPSVKKVSLAFSVLGFSITSKLLGVYIFKNNHMG